jgi:ElaB/YqjD/DUF883 family membrane-anchored ribosome-binding protein
MPLVLLERRFNSNSITIMNASVSDKPSLSQATNELRQAASEKARAFVQQAESKATELRSCANEQWHDSREKAQELHAQAEDYIRQNPTKCILGAIGVGFLIGLITRR